MRAEQQRGEPLVRYATLALPAAAVLAVGYAVVVAGKPLPVVAARIRGGPTEGVSTLSFRIEAVEHQRDRERGVAGGRLSLDATLANGTALHWEGDLDDEGAANASLEPPATVTGPVHVHVALQGPKPPSGTPDAPPVALLDDTLGLRAEEWFAGSRRRGGWIEGHGALAIRVAAGRGAFAVPYHDSLVIEVRREGRGLAGAIVRAAAEGADVEPGETVTDSRGRAMVSVRPREHAATVSVHAHAPTGEDASLDAALVVVPGALRATLSNGQLLVESPIVRERAYVTLVGERQRILGRTVRLSPDESGGARGTMPLPELDHEPPVALRPVWAVVSSEPDQKSTSLVGWPLVSAADGPQSTFDVPDALLADGVAAALARENERVGRIRTAGAAVAVALLSLSGALLVVRARLAEQALARHLDENLADEETTTRLVDASGGRGWLLTAILCVALGAVLIAVFALWH